MDKFRSSGLLQLITVFISLISISVIVVTNSMYQREVKRAEAKIVTVLPEPNTYYLTPTTYDPSPTSDLPSPTANPTLTSTPTPKKSLSPTAKPNPTTHYSPPITDSPTPTTQSSQPSSTPTPTSIPTGNYQTVYVTWYGWNDNDPPGPAIAYPAGKYPTKHTSANGVGSYDDPVTFASDGTYSVGQIIYVPYIKKYAIKEDLCATCSGNHIDIWMGGNGSFGNELHTCQYHWTRSTTQIELNPPNGRAVEYTPIFNSSNGQCLN